MTFHALAEYYTNQFKANVLTLESIARVKTFREVLVSIYYELASQSKITRIENLTEPDKRELWNEALDTGKELDKDEKIKYCKAMYALNHLL